MWPRRPREALASVGLGVRAGHSFRRVGLGESDLFSWLVLPLVVLMLPVVAMVVGVVDVGNGE